MSTRTLSEEERDIFDATDLARLDGYAGHISCSIEYPNAWYFTKAKAGETLFKEWVILFIAPHYLWQPDTLFCPRNAASEGGRYVDQGSAAFASLFAQRVPSPRCPLRRALHLLASPTDDQAEALVADQIAASDILAIAVPSAEQAALEQERLNYLGLGDQVKFVVAPTLFDPRALARAIRAGERPLETEWHSREA